MKTNDTFKTVYFFLSSCASHPAKEKYTHLKKFLKNYNPQPGRYNSNEQKFCLGQNCRMTPMQHGEQLRSGSERRIFKPICKHGEPHFHHVFFARVGQILSQQNLNQKARMETKHNEYSKSLHFKSDVDQKPKSKGRILSWSLRITRF